MESYGNKKLLSKLQERLNTQNRKLNIDGNAIFVCPFFEQSKVDKIKFYMSDDKDAFLSVSRINSLSFVNDKIEIILDDGTKGNLFYKNKKGDLVCAAGSDLHIRDVSIDHTPSIYIELYMMYISNDPDFELLTDFSKALINATDEVINTRFMKKTKVFRELVQRVLVSNSKFINAIPKIYEKLFSNIDLELSIDNTANLSFNSLEFYRINKNKRLGIDEDKSLGNDVVDFTDQIESNIVSNIPDSKAKSRLSKWMNDKNSKVHIVIKTFLYLEKQSPNKEVKISDLIQLYPDGKNQLPSLKTDSGKSYGKIFENCSAKGYIRLTPEIDLIIDRNGW